jgi:hypothetical protein
MCIESLTDGAGQKEYRCFNVFHADEDIIQEESMTMGQLTSVDTSEAVEDSLFGECD